MIEIFLFGDYKGSPHEVGAWAYLFRRGDEILGQGRGLEHPAAVTSRLATEAAALAFALEKLVGDQGAEDVGVHAASPGLEGLLVCQGQGAARDVAHWYTRIREAAHRCLSLRLIHVHALEIRQLRESVREILPTEAVGAPVPRASEVFRHRRAAP